VLALEGVALAGEALDVALGCGLERVELAGLGLQGVVVAELRGDLALLAGEQVVDLLLREGGGRAGSAAVASSSAALVGAVQDEAEALVERSEHGCLPGGVARGTAAVRCPRLPSWSGP
jgi:hypothetical protein